MVERAADNRDTQVQLLSGLPFIWERLLENARYVMFIGTIETKYLGEGITNHILNRVNGLRSCALLNLGLKQNKPLGEVGNYLVTEKEIFGIGIRRSGRVVKVGGL